MKRGCLFRKEVRTGGEFSIAGRLVWGFAGESWERKQKQANGKEMSRGFSSGGGW